MNVKVLVYIAASVDGYIARKNGDVDWLNQFESPELGKNYQEFYEKIDIIIMGNNTYKQIKGFEKFPYRDKKCYVFSRNKSNPIDENVVFVNETPNKFLERFNANKRKVWLVGGASLIKQFLSKELIDEFIITTVPLILGRGIPLFKEHSLIIVQT
jgi:dihydrofolate reductase